MHLLLNENHLGEECYNFVTQHLSRWKYYWFQRHLKKCAQCQSEVKDLTLTLKLLDKFKPPPLSAEFQEKVLQKIRDLPLPRPLPPQPLTQRIKGIIQAFHYRPFLGGMAVTTATAILLWMTFPGGFRPQGLFEADKVTKDLQIILSKETQAIFIQTTDLQKTSGQIRKLVVAHKGKILFEKEEVDEREISLSVGKDQETIFLNELRRFGLVQTDSTVYRDKNGNIMVKVKKK